MISLFAADSATTRLSLSYNGLTFNQTPTNPDSSFLIEQWSIQPNIAFVSDGNEAQDGMEAYDPRKQGGILVLSGLVAEVSDKALFDKMKSIAKTFDPVLIARNNPTVNGFLALDFTTLTADTANYANGLVLSRYYVRPQRPVGFQFSKEQGRNVKITLPFLLRDMRRYWQTQSSASLSALSNAVDNSLADYFSWPTVTIAATGAGSATFTINNVGDTKTSLVLNLSSLVNADSVVIDMEKRSITKNGISTPSLYVSGEFFDLLPQSNTITISDLTNLTVSMTWRRAWAI